MEDFRVETGEGFDSKENKKSTGNKNDVLFEVEILPETHFVGCVKNDMVEYIYTCSDEFGAESMHSG